MQKIDGKTVTRYDRLPHPTSWSLRAQNAAFVALLVLGDFLSAIGAMVLAYKIRIEGFVFGWTYSYGAFDEFAYRVAIGAAGPIWVLWAAVLGLYTADNLLGGHREYKQTFKTCAAGIFTIILASFALRTDDSALSRMWILLSWALSTTLMLAMRFQLRRLAYGLRLRGFLTARVLIVGANDHGAAIARQWALSPRSGIRVLGFLDDFKAIGSTVVDNLKVIGRPTALGTITRELRADEVVVVSSAMAWETFGELMSPATVKPDYTMRLSPGFYEMLTSGMAVTNKTFVPLLTMNKSRIVGVDAALKRGFDLFMGLLAVLTLLPVALAVALGLKVQFPKSPVFRRRRMLGLGGKVFEMTLFNTHDAELAHRHGVRRGNLPSWLVWTGFDKWPQLVNVLLGQMSLVGPRPLPESTHIPPGSEVNNLLAVRPGILGPWFVHDASRSPDLVHDEVNYVRNWEIWRDIPIVLHAIELCLRRLVSFDGKNRPNRSNSRDQTGDTVSDDVLP
jgi:lipopolysaccharide/colanic/teichoic acid biosynthesis glycosyltransferase